MTGTRGEAFGSVRELLLLYFDGLYCSDVQLLEQVFHPRAIYCCETGDETVFRSMPEYFEVVGKRTSPASRQEIRRDEIESIEFAGPATARARVRCSIGQRHYTDFLTLILAAGSWQIVSKVFHYEVVSTLV